MRTTPGPPGARRRRRSRRRAQLGDARWRASLGTSWSLRSTNLLDYARRLNECAECTGPLLEALWEPAVGGDRAEQDRHRTGDGDGEQRQGQRRGGAEQRPQGVADREDEVDDP